MIAQVGQRIPDETNPQILETFQPNGCTTIERAEVICSPTESYGNIVAERNELTTEQEFQPQERKLVHLPDLDKNLEDQVTGCVGKFHTHAKSAASSNVTVAHATAMLSSIIVGMKQEDMRKLNLQRDLEEKRLPPQGQAPDLAALFTSSEIESSGGAGGLDGGDFKVDGLALGLDILKRHMSYLVDNLGRRIIDPTGTSMDNEHEFTESQSSPAVRM